MKIGDRVKLKDAATFLFRTGKMFNTGCIISETQPFKVRTTYLFDLNNRKLKHENAIVQCVEEDLVLLDEPCKDIICVN